MTQIRFVKSYVFFILTIIIFSSFNSVFSENYSQQIFVHIDPFIISGNEKVTIKISITSNSTINKEFVINVVSPEGITYNTNAVAHLDGNGFVSITKQFPNNFSGSSSTQGVYSVYIQDKESGDLISTSNFEVNSWKPETLDFISKFILPVIVLPSSAAGITFFYSFLTKKKEIARNLYQKKSELFLTSSKYHLGIMHAIKGIISAIEDEKTSKEHLRSFYFIINYIQARKEFTEKVGSFFLDDIETENMLVELNRVISENLRSTFGALQIYQFQELLKKNQNPADLKKLITKNKDAQDLFKHFNDCMNNNEKNINDIILLMKIYNFKLDAEINTIFRDWYTDKKKVDADINNNLDLARNLMADAKKQKLVK